MLLSCYSRHVRAPGAAGGGVCDSPPQVGGHQRPLSVSIKGRGPLSTSFGIYYMSRAINDLCRYLLKVGGCYRPLSVSIIGRGPSTTSVGGPLTTSFGIYYRSGQLTTLSVSIIGRGHQRPLSVSIKGRGRYRPLSFHIQLRKTPVTDVKPGGRPEREGVGVVMESWASSSGAVTAPAAGRAGAIRAKKIIYVSTYVELAG
ncbi:hypothetical protein EVAR_8387_1 [Eumeta japonica]|uniref:Uncharacterized protein n=1 Tax=Eumeta variegata TaxID=151549 RepID=A0A4C1VE67_EUMVA|nr:hypothetical protein EVAR_8387_1 [Eumeta japonica]